VERRKKRKQCKGTARDKRALTASAKWGIHSLDTHPATKLAQVVPLLRWRKKKKDKKSRKRKESTPSNHNHNNNKELW
jgi:hypothetical protein